MPSAVRCSLLLMIAVCCLPRVATAQYRLSTRPGSFDAPVSTAVTLKDISGGAVVVESAAIELPPADYSGPVSGMGGMMYRKGRYYPPGASPMTLLNRPRPPQEPQWVIPVGEFGLELTNGMRMTGRPSKDWAARITTTFGVVVIPLPQIAHIAPAGNGQFSAFLKNGDRVTGSLLSNTMTFETKFGRLNIVATDIVRLRASAAAATPSVAGTVPASSSVTSGKRVEGTSNRVLIGPSAVPEPTRLLRGLRRPRPK